VKTPAISKILGFIEFLEFWQFFNSKNSGSDDAQNEQVFLPDFQFIPKRSEKSYVTLYIT